MEKRDNAVALLKSLHHCAQAVLCAYADELDVSEETMKRFGAAFGGGMATMEGNCGALVGAAMVLGLKKYQGKRIHNETVQLYRLFEEKCGATVCKDLKGVGTGKVLCSCEECVQNAVDALEEVLNSQAPVSGEFPDDFQDE